MIGKKKLPPVAFEVFRPVPEHRAELYNHVSGKQKLKTPPYGCTAAKLSDNMVIGRTYRPDNYRLALFIGGTWTEHPLLISPEDAGIRALDAAGHLVDYGESPRAKQEREQREAERRARHEAVRAHHEGRRQHHLSIRQEFERRKREAARARHG